mmetsp:Transcript_61613/g.148395  ORF Transcript_61613/g.148395 Transcript_61613/m.148395 type:complete len:291 (+) Transcript_61613:78-950(+)
MTTRHASLREAPTWSEALELVAGRLLFLGGVELLAPLALLLLDDVRDVLRRVGGLLGLAQLVVFRLERASVELVELAGVERQVHPGLGRLGRLAGGHVVRVRRAECGAAHLAVPLLDDLVELLLLWRVGAARRLVGGRVEPVVLHLAQVHRVGRGNARGRRGDGGDAGLDLAVRHRLGIIIGRGAVLLVLLLLRLLELVLRVHLAPQLLRHRNVKRHVHLGRRRAEDVSVQRPAELVDRRLAPAARVVAVGCALGDGCVQPGDLQAGVRRRRAVALHVDQPRRRLVVIHA